MRKLLFLVMLTFSLPLLRAQSVEEIQNSKEYIWEQKRFHAQEKPTMKLYFINQPDFHQCIQPIQPAHRRRDRRRQGYGGRDLQIGHQHLFTGYPEQHPSHRHTNEPGSSCHALHQSERDTTIFSKAANQTARLYPRSDKSREKAQVADALRYY